MTEFADIKTLVVAHIGGNDRVESLVEGRINRAILDIVTTHMPHETRTSYTETTVAGTAAYTLQTDCYAIRMVRDDDNKVVIDPGTLRHYANSELDTTNGGSYPTSWIREGNQLVLYNTVPGGAYSITYYYLKRPTILTADADTFPLNYEWEEPVAALAASKLLVVLNEPERAGAKFAEYQAMVEMNLKPGEIEAKIPETKVEFPNAFDPYYTY